MNGIIDKLFELGGRTILKESKILLKTGFRLASERVGENFEKKSLRYAGGCELTFALPSCKMPLIIGYHVLKDQVNIVYVCSDGVARYFSNQASFGRHFITPYQQRCLSELQTAFHEGVVKAAANILDSFRLVPRWFPLGMSRRDSREYLSLGYEKAAPYLTAIYDDLEKRGFALQPVKVGMPFVFRNSQGHEVVLCRDKNNTWVAVFSVEAEQVVEGLSELPGHINEWRKARMKLVQQRSAAIVKRCLTNERKLRRAMAMHV